jgi:hypothetical protein
MYINTEVQQVIGQSRGGRQGPSDQENAESQPPGVENT